MSRSFFLALTLAACSSPAATTDAHVGDGATPDVPLSADCIEAANHSDLMWIQQNIFGKQCTFSGCHNGAPTLEGMMNLKSVDTAESETVDVASEMCPAEMRVVAGHPEQSWMLKMLGAISDTTPPSCTIDPKVGIMPMDNGGSLLCKNKLDAITRWIQDGATEAGSGSGSGSAQ